MIVVDVETGGLDPRKNPILSIGAVDFNSGREFYAECFPRADLTIEDSALAVNGYTRERLALETKTTKQMLEEFLDWCSVLSSDYTIAGENPSFDRDFIAENLKFYGIQNPFGHRTVDLHSLAYARMTSKGSIIPQDGRKNKLNADVIFVYCGFPAEPRPHIAITGAKYEAEAFHRILENKQYYEEFKNFGLFPHEK